MAWCPFYEHEFNNIPAWINNSFHYKMGDEISHPFPEYNGVAVEV